MTEIGRELIFTTSFFLDSSLIGRRARRSNLAFLWRLTTADPGRYVFLFFWRGFLGAGWARGLGIWEGGRVRFWCRGRGRSGASRRGRWERLHEKQGSSTPRM